MNYNYLPKKKSNSQFVDNKETFNNRLFQRNNLNREIYSQNTVAPQYMSENYNINRKSAQSIFNKRIIPEISKKPIVDFVNFRDNEINGFNANKKHITNIDQMAREKQFFDSSNNLKNQINFKNNLINNLSKNPFVNNNQTSNIPTKIDFSKSNLSFFIDQNK